MMTSYLLYIGIVLLLISINPCDIISLKKCRPASFHLSPFLAGLAARIARLKYQQTLRVSSFYDKPGADCIGLVARKNRPTGRILLSNRSDP